MWWRHGARGVECHKNSLNAAAAARLVCARRRDGSANTRLHPLLSAVALLWVVIFVVAFTTLWV